MELIELIGFAAGFLVAISSLTAMSFITLLMAGSVLVLKLRYN